MLNKFAQWCGWVAEMRYHEAESPLRRPSRQTTGGRARRLALTIGILGLHSLAAADVGLPRYDSDSPMLPGQPPGLKQISHTDDSAGLESLDCHGAGWFAATALDMAPPGDKRVDIRPVPVAAAPDDSLSPGVPENSARGENVSASMTALLNGNRAVVRIGEVVNKVRAERHDALTLLTSNDRDYFNRLRGVRPADTLLVEDSQTIRRYRVRSAEIIPVVNDSPEPRNGLVLASCYPFQNLGHPPLLYMVFAEPVPTPLDDAAEGNEEAGRYATLRF